MASSTTVITVCGNLWFLLPRDFLIKHLFSRYAAWGKHSCKLGGLNLVGLRRHGSSLEDRRVLSRVLKTTYRAKLHLSKALEHIDREIEQTSTFSVGWIFVANLREG
ncbi:MAG: hypothetical protein ACRDAI_00150 [Candidatus Rhabdochlamydia sp.]